MATDNHVHTSIDIPVKDHRKLKAMAALRGVSMKEIILECLSRELYSDNVPNKETEKVMKDSEEGKNVTHHKNFKALRSHLEL